MTALSFFAHRRHDIRVAGRAFPCPFPHFLPSGRLLFRLGVEVGRGHRLVSRAPIETTQLSLVLLYGVRSR